MKNKLLAGFLSIFALGGCGGVPISSSEAKLRIGSPLSLEEYAVSFGTITVKQIGMGNKVEAMRTKRINERDKKLFWALVEGTEY